MFFDFFQQVNKHMATIKVKFRPSLTGSGEGSIYYQVIQDRKPRQVSTRYRVRQSEWNERKATVFTDKADARWEYIIRVRQQIKFDLERFGRVIRGFESKGLCYSADDIVEEYGRIMERNSLFVYMDGLIAGLKADGRVRTSETYRSTLNSFRKYRQDEDILLECLNRNVMESYEAWLRMRGNSRNTISFYIRILRAVYNRAVQEELTEDRNPFRSVYT